MEYQKDSNKFRCIEHQKVFQGKAAAARHSTAIHKFTLEGEKIHDKVHDSLETSQNEPEFSEIESIVYANLNHEYARGGTQIAQNTDLRFIYEKTKTMFPPEWNYGVWIEGLVSFALSEFGISASVWQNKENLSQDKLEFIKAVHLDWGNILKNS